MNTTTEQTVTGYEQHQLDMLLWHADVHAKNAENRRRSELGRGLPIF